MLSKPMVQVPHRMANVGLSTEEENFIGDPSSAAHVELPVSDVTHRAIAISLVGGRA